MSKKMRHYTEEFKQESVKLAISSPSVSGVAKELGIPDATLHTWVQKAKRTGLQAAPAQSQDPSQPVNVGELVKENQRLHKELSRLKQEKTILKKAAAYFAREHE